MFRCKFAIDKRSGELLTGRCARAPRVSRRAQKQYEFSTKRETEGIIPTVSLREGQHERDNFGEIGSR